MLMWILMCNLFPTWQTVLNVSVSSNLATYWWLKFVQDVDCGVTLRFWHLYNLVWSCISFLEPVKKEPSDYIRRSFLLSPLIYSLLYFPLSNLHASVLLLDKQHISKLNLSCAELWVEARHSWWQTYRWSMLLVARDQLFSSSLLPSQIWYIII